MPEAAQIRVLQKADGASVYRVIVGVGGSVAIIRDFKSNADAERFVQPKYKGSAKDQRRG